MANFVSVVISGNSKPLRTALDKATANMTGFQKKVAYGFVAAGAAATAFAAAAVKAAAKDQVAMESLERQIRSSTGASDKQIKASESYLKAAGRASAYGKSALIPGFKSLVTATHDATKAQGLMNVALDVARARNLDVSTVSEALAKAYAGNTRGLRSLSPEMKKLIADGASFSDVLKVLNKNFGGAAAGYAKTFQGRLDILNNSTSALKKQIGYALLPVVERIIPVFQKVADVMLKHPALVTAIAVGVGLLAAAFITATVAVTAWKIAAQATMLINTALGTTFTTLEVAAGPIIAALAAGAAVYAIFAGSSKKAAAASMEFNDALFQTGDAQKQAITELLKTSDAFQTLGKIMQIQGTTKNVFADFINNNSGALADLKVRIDAAVKSGHGLMVWNSKGQGFNITAKDAKTYKTVLDQLIQAQKDYKTQQEILNTLGLGDVSEAEKKAAEERKKRFAEFKKTLADTKKSIQEYVKSILSAISSTVSLSNSVSDAKSNDDAYKSALADRKKAYEALNQAALTNDVNAYNDALAKVAETEKAVSDAETKPRDYTSIFRAQVQAAKDFAGYLKQLVAPPYSLKAAGLQQLLNLGPVAGAQVAKDLLSGTAGLTVGELNTSLADVAAAGTAVGMNIPGVSQILGAKATNVNNKYEITVQAGVGDKVEIAKQVVELLQAYEKRLGGIPIKVKG